MERSIRGSGRTEGSTGRDFLSWLMDSRGKVFGQGANESGGNKSDPGLVYFI